MLAAAGIGGVALVALVIALAYANPSATADRLERFGIGVPRTAAFADQMRRQLWRLDRNLEPGHALFFGDSHVQTLDVAAVVPGAVNFGIGGETAGQLAERMRHYSSLAGASIVVLLTGTNDLRQHINVDEIADHVASIVAIVPADIPVVLVSALPEGRELTADVSPVRIRDLNQALRAVCDARCRFIDVFARLADSDGFLRPLYDEGDGIHLSPHGAAVLRGALRTVIDDATDRRSLDRAGRQK